MEMAETPDKQRNLGYQTNEGPCAYNRAKKHLGTVKIHIKHDGEYRIKEETYTVGIHIIL